MKLYEMPPSAGPSFGQPDYYDPEANAWEMARASAEADMKLPDVVAEVFDDGMVLMPAELAKLVAIASQCPATAPGVTSKLFELIGEQFVEWVCEVMAAQAFEGMKS